jgi:hypothetical protein
MVPTAALADYHRDGFVVARGLFSEAECAVFIDHYMAMLANGGEGWAEGGVHPEDADPLRRYPRLLQPHRGDKLSFDYMVDPRLDDWLTALLGASPFAVQTMVYFKAPGSKGQALHQDQRYLRVEPGTCMAAWMALEDCDEENGCMFMVPGSHTLPILCPGVADLEDSWGHDFVAPPPGMEAVPVTMKAGDVVFFNGQVIHGSHKNHSETRFRRILVGHYIVAEAEKVAHYYFPVFNMRGEEVSGLDANEWGGGPCGTMSLVDGELVYVPQGELAAAGAAH